MKAYWLFILILIISALCGCTKSESIMMPLDGSWVDISTSSDTIIFTQFGTDPAFELRRGPEERNGYLLPRYGAGIYCYKITGDTIALEDLLSSAGGYINFYFKQNTDGSFVIGNFYDQAFSPNEKITFLRIK